MKQVFILLLLSYTSLTVFSQGSCSLKGNIIDAGGKPIPYASVYIPELSSGTMSNSEGEFSLKISCGNYNLKVKRPDYESKIVPIKVNLNSNKLRIQLKAVSYQSIKNNIAKSTEEDPAYRIIRKAVVMAQYYKHQIKSYETDIYHRSFTEEDNIPNSIKSFAESLGIADLQKGGLDEILLHYSYDKPNAVSENIIAKKTKVEDTTKSVLSPISLNFYDWGGQNIINPLSRNSFKVYEFEYKGNYMDNDRRVHKIKLLPKRKGGDLMYGFLYINDGLWNLNHLSIVLKKQLFQLEYHQSYHEIKPLLWLPTNHHIKISDKAIGLQFQMKHIANLNKISVQSDTTVDNQIKNILKNLKNQSPKKGKSNTLKENAKKNAKRIEQKIENVIQEGELNNRRTIKLVRLIKKQRQKSKNVGLKERSNFEIEHEINYNDSAFNHSKNEWKAMRHIPLSEKEKTFYKTIDTTNKAQVQTTAFHETTNFIKNLFIFNGTFTSKNKKHIFKPNGFLVGLWPYFSTVNGFTPEKTILDYKWINKKGKFIELTPIVGYAVARETFTARVEVDAQYNKEKRGQFNISGGRRTVGFNRKDPISDRLNTISTTFFTKNPKKLYQQDYIDIDHQIDLINGLTIKLGGEYANRKPLSNNSDFQLLDITNRIYTPNKPINKEVSNKSDLTSSNTAITFTAALSWTPKQFYTFKNNQKILLESNYPTFELGYRKGVDGILNSESNYDVINFSIQQSFSFHLIDQINYYIEAGKFLSRKSIYFADYQNFNTAPTFVIDNAKTNGFRLLDYYAFNTKDAYLEGHFSIENDHLFLKHLPLIDRTNFDEKIEFSYLYTDRNIHFTEAGLSLTNIFFLMDAGAFVSFKDAKYNSWAIKLAFYFLQ